MNIYRFRIAGADDLVVEGDKALLESDGARVFEMSRCVADVPEYLSVEVHPRRQDDEKDKLVAECVADIRRGLEVRRAQVQMASSLGLKADTAQVVVLIDMAQSLLNTIGASLPEPSSGLSQHMTMDEVVDRARQCAADIEKLVAERRRV